MFKYIVTWVIIKAVIGMCPQTEPTPDEFGRVPALRIQTTAACYTYDTTYMEKEFNKRDSAISFIKRGTNKNLGATSPYTDLGMLKNFELDSIFVQPKKATRKQP